MHPRNKSFPAFVYFAMALGCAGWLQAFTGPDELAGPRVWRPVDIPASEVMLTLQAQGVLLGTSLKPGKSGSLKISGEELAAPLEPLLPPGVDAEHFSSTIARWLPQFERYAIAASVHHPKTGLSHLFVAVSRSSTIDDSWSLFRFDPAGEGLDLQDLSVSADRWGLYLTARATTETGEHTAELWSFDQRILEGKSPSYQRFSSWRQADGSLVKHLQKAPVTSSALSASFSEQATLFAAVDDEGRRSLWKISGDRSQEPVVSRAEPLAPSVVSALPAPR